MRLPIDRIISRLFMGSFYLMDLCYTTDNIQQNQLTTLKMRLGNNTFLDLQRYNSTNHLIGGQVVRIWDQRVCSPCNLRFDPVVANMMVIRGIHGR